MKEQAQCKHKGVNFSKSVCESEVTMSVNTQKNFHGNKNGM
jgi:hypothetical protein